MTALSFTVARRRREIGIRIALGTDRRRILGGIFARSGAQLGLGVAVALHDAFVLMPIVAAIVVAVSLMAALGPARRGLAVQPTEALREE